MSTFPGLNTAQTLETLESVQRRMSDAVTRLQDATGRSGRLADQTNWRTGAASMFHVTADEWRRDVTRLTDSVESIRDEVRTARARIEAHMWSSGG